MVFFTLRNCLDIGVCHIFIFLMGWLNCSATGNTNLSVLAFVIYTWNWYEALEGGCGFQENKQLKCIFLDFQELIVNWQESQHICKISILQWGLFCVKLCKKSTPWPLEHMVVKSSVIFSFMRFQRNHVCKMFALMYAKFNNIRIWGLICSSSPYLHCNRFSVQCLLKQQCSYSFLHLCSSITVGDAIDKIVLRVSRSTFYSSNDDVAVKIFN